MVLGQGPSQDARSLPSRRRCDAGELGFSSNHLGLPSLLFSDRIRLALKYKAQIYFLSDSRLTIRLSAEGSASIFGGPPISYFWAY